MTRYVVDASVVVQLLITDTNSAETEVLFDSIDDGNKLYIPEFGLLECTNVLWKYVRFQNLKQSDAESLVDDLIELDVVMTPAIGLMPRALKIGLKHQLAIYDSIYITLAERLTYPLITADRRQTKAAKAEGLTLKDIADFTS